MSVAGSGAGRRLRLVALAAGATVLAGCGFHPGAAAVVGSETISREHVDAVAQAVCSANLASAKMSNQPPPRLASRGAREVAMQILLETELIHQFGEQQGVEANPREVSEAVAQNEAGLRLLPADQREDFRQALNDYTEGQLILVEVGRKSRGAALSPDEAMAEGARLFESFAKNADVEVDPRYGTFEAGAFQRGGASLSVPASDEAREAERPRPGDGYVASLPASQQCR